MGLFSKIKKNLSHGGVKIQLEAPASTSIKDAGLPVSITVTATDSLAPVKAVRAEIIAESNNQSFSSPSDSGMDNSQSTLQTVARAENVEPFTLAPGESKTIELKIIMNAGSAIADQLPGGGAGAAIAKGLARLETISETLNQNSYTYQLQGTADLCLA